MCIRDSKQYVDKIVAGVKELWKELDISYDQFIRTTDDYHVAAVQKIFKQLYDQGDIYKSEYEGWYCTPCESFYTDVQLVDGKCPDCGREVERLKEESYFFRLSKYQDRLIKHIEEHPESVSYTHLDVYKRQPITGYGIIEILIGLGLAVFCNLLGHSIVSWSLKYLTPAYVSAVKLCEPVFSTILGVLIFREIPNAMQVLGAAIIIGGVYVYSAVENAATEKSDN